MTALRLLFGPAGAGCAFVLSALLLFATLTECAGKTAVAGQFRAAEAGRVKVVGELAECRADMSRLSAAVDEQNAAVKAFEADSARRLAAAETAVREAQAAAAGARTKARAILARGASGGPPDLCRSAEAVLRGGEG
jgi:hypothetical protein